jgi:hypothetical protein
VIVLDSSAVLASFFGEPGFERVDDALPEAMISVVNAIEVLTRLARDDHDIDRMAARLRATGVSFEPLELGAGADRLSARSIGTSPRVVLGRPVLPRAGDGPRAAGPHGRSGLGTA